MNETLIKRSDVAGILGVSPATVSNYIERGLLKEFDSQGNRAIFVTAASLARLLEEINDIKDTETAIENYKKELETEEAEQRALVRQARRERNSTLYLSRLMNKDALQMYEFFFGDLPEREGNIIRQLALGYTREEVAANAGFTVSHINQLLDKNIRRMHKRIKQGENYLSIELKCRKQERKIAWLEKKLAEAQVTIPDDREDLFLPIENFNLSVRCLNCCNYAGIKTPKDLMSYSKADLFKIRNFGKKTFVEIEELMTNLGISLRA